MATEEPLAPPEAAAVRSGRHATKETPIQVATDRAPRSDIIQYAESCRSMETTLRSTSQQPIGKSTTERITYLCLTVPWTTFVVFLYTLLTLLPSTFCMICNAAKPLQYIAIPARKVYSIHESQMQVGLPNSSIRVLVLHLFSPFIAILIAFAGALAAISQIYSFVLGEHDGTATILDWTLCTWLAWLLLFCNDLDELDRPKVDDLV